MSVAVKQVAIIIGVGPGLGAALCRRFVEGGFHVVAMARGTEGKNKTMLETELPAELKQQFEYLPVDCSDLAAVKSQVDSVTKRANTEVVVLIYNAGMYLGGSFLDLDAEKMMGATKVGAMSCLVASQGVLPGMVARKKGSILITGATASMRGGNRFFGLAGPKFMLRAMAQSMAREFGPQGVHVAHVVVDGQIGTPGQLASRGDRSIDSFMDASALAELYWQLHSQHPSVWTLEQDVRPAVEKF